MISSGGDHPALPVGPHLALGQRLSHQVDAGAVDTQRTVRVGLHVIHLALQLVRGEEIVVPVAHENILSPGPGKIERSADVVNALGILVFLLNQRPHPAGILCLVLAAAKSCRGVSPTGQST